MFNKWKLKELKPVLKWPPPPEESMSEKNESEKKGIFHYDKTYEVLTMPGICSKCGQRDIVCRCKDPEECEHQVKRKMDWPDGAYSEICTKCLKTRLLWEQGESEWQDHKYKSIADWYKEALEVQQRWEKL